MDASRTMTQPTIRTHRSPALPHHLHQFPRLRDCHPRLALVDPIQILRRFPHRILVVL
ncbi:hypothetical protein BGY98DRAFT_1038639, partial [Russula aff. rugulosa BPL654]